MTPPAAPPERGAKLLAAASLAGATLVPIAFFLSLYPLITPMPLWDQWSFVPVWTAHYAGRPVLPLLLEPYAGHCNVLAKLCFYGLGLISHWDVRLEVLASFFAACGTLALLIGMARRDGFSGGLLAFPMAAQVFSLSQFVNFMYGYPLGQNLSQMLATFVISRLTARSLSTAGLAGAGLAAVGSALSWGAGITTFPLGLLALMVRRDGSRARVAAWLLASAAMIVLVTTSASGRLPEPRWSTVPQFFLVLLGKAYSVRAFPSTESALVIGALAALTFVGLAVSAYRCRSLRCYPWIILGLYSLAAAALIAVGRCGSPNGLQQALESHYVTATYPLVVSCIALSLSLLEEHRARGAVLRVFRRAAPLLLASGCVIQPLLVSVEMLPILKRWNPVVRSNDLAIARETATAEQIRAGSHPEPSLVLAGVGTLKAHRLAWFQELCDGETPAGSVDLIGGQGNVSQPLRIKGYQPWSIEGWAVRSGRKGGPLRAVQLFVDGRHVAAAVLDIPRPDVAEHFASKAFGASGWSVAVAADAVDPGVHWLWIAAVDFSGGLHPLFEASVEFLREQDGGR